MTKSMKTMMLTVAAAMFAVPFAVTAQTAGQKDPPASIASPVSSTSPEPASPAATMRENTAAMANAPTGIASANHNQPDYSKNPYWEPRDWTYINNNTSN